jgi:hypothetical protein
MAMHVGSQLKRAEALLTEKLIPRSIVESVLLIGLVPIFFTDFIVDIVKEGIRTAFSHFHVRTQLQTIHAPSYTFDGLVRDANGDIAILGRNGGI